MSKPDPITGFPEVPEGYFWEITKSASIKGYFRLELRRKYFWVFSDRVRFSLISAPLSAERLYEEAEYILEKCEEDLNRRATENASNVYIGKYPPKSLKDTK